MDYNGSHYKLITYKKRGAFIFKELPYQIKQLIVNKCLERLAGPFYIIPDFKSYNENFKAPILEFKAGVNIEADPHLYDDEQKLQFYGNSNEKPLARLWCW